MLPCCDAHPYLLKSSKAWKKINETHTADGNIYTDVQVGVKSRKICFILIFEADRSLALTVSSNFINQGNFTKQWL